MQTTMTNNNNNNNHNKGASCWNLIKYWFKDIKLILSLMTAMILVFEFHQIIQTDINKAKYNNTNNNKSSNRIRSPWTIEEDKDFNSFASSQRVIEQIKNSYMTVQGNDDDLIIITIIEKNNNSTNIIDDGTSVDTEPVLSNDDENEEKEEVDDDDDDALDSTDNIQRLSLLRRRRR